MANEFQDVTALLAKLKLQIAENEDVSPAVKTFHDIILSSDTDQIAQFVNEEALDLLINLVCLARDPETTLLCEDIVDYALRSIPDAVLLKKFLNQFIHGLNSTSAIIKCKFLRVMRHAVENDSSILAGVMASSAGSPILIAACRCVSDPNEEAAAEAQRFLIEVALQKDGRAILFQQNDLAVVKALRDLANNSTEIVKFRFYEIVSSLSRISKEMFDDCVKIGFVDLLLKELESKDILIKLNIFEILTTMTIDSNYCLTYFNEKGIFAGMYTMLDQSKSDPDATFLFPGVVKFFGHLARVEPVLCDTRYPKFLESVFHLVINYRLLEISQRLLAFDSLAMMSSTSAGKLVLGKHGESMQKCMKCFGACIREGPVEMRMRHLEALAQMFIVEEEKCEDPSVLKLTELWLQWMKNGTVEEPLTFLIDVLKKPIPEIRKAMCVIFKNLIKFPWAQKRMLDEPGFIDFVTEPLSDRDQSFNMFRHEYVGLILKLVSTTNNHLNEETKKRLQAFYDNGPYYRGISRVELGMESG